MSGAKPMPCNETISVQGITISCNMRHYFPHRGVHHYADDKVSFFWENTTPVRVDSHPWNFWQRMTAALVAATTECSRLSKN